jgi:hypothetical protein
MPSCKVQAWNNFVMRSDPSSHEQGSRKRAAAIACLYMGLANNGGLNSFLTSTCDLDASEVVDALTVVGAHLAARQLDRVVQGLGKPLRRSSQEERERTCWKNIGPMNLMTSTFFRVKQMPNYWRP